MQFLVDIALSLIYICAFLLIVVWSWRFWVFFVQQSFINSFNKDSIMLEIKLPRDIPKSPAALEMAIDVLRQGGGIGDWYAKYWKGGMPTTASLEIASLEGELHFYVRIHKKFRKLVESSFYSQFPEIEIVEADDYTKLIRYNHLNKDVGAWAIEYFLGGKMKPHDKDGKPFKKGGKDYEMKADILPIKTYKDYGLDKDPDEEFKMDPMTNILELMGSIGKDEYVWYQILIQDEGAYNGKKFPKLFVNEVSHDRYNLSDLANMRKAQIRKVKKIAKGTSAYDQYGNLIQRTKVGEDGRVTLEEVKYGEDKELFSKDSELNQDDKDELEAINNKLSKPLAACLIRVLYLKRNGIDPQHIQTTLHLFKPYTGSNSFAPAIADGYSFPWENFGNKRVPWRIEEMFEAYVEREGIYPHIGNENNSLQKLEDSFLFPFSLSFRKNLRAVYDIIFRPFYHPVPNRFSVLNLEEIVSLWHFPGTTANVPSLPRINSKKGLPPTDLPV